MKEEEGKAMHEKDGTRGEKIIRKVHEKEKLRKAKRKKLLEK